MNSVAMLSFTTAHFTPKNIWLLVTLSHKFNAKEYP